MDIQCAAGGRTRLRNDGIAVHCHGENLRRAAGLGGLHRKMEDAGLDVGNKFQADDVRCGHGLQPDSLPDAGRGRVKDAVRAKALLAENLRIRPVDQQRVCRRDDKVIGAGRKGVGHIALKRRVTSAMGCNLFSIHPHGAVPIDGSKVQEQPLPPPRRGDIERAMIPEALPRGAGLADSGQGRFVSKGDQYLPSVSGGWRGIVRAAESVIPEAIEVEPIGPRELRAGILGKGMLRRNLGCPDGLEGAGSHFPIGSAGGAHQ